MIGGRKPRPSRLHKLNYILQINVALHCSVARAATRTVSFEPEAISNSFVISRTIFRIHLFC